MTEEQIRQKIRESQIAQNMPIKIVNSIIDQVIQAERDRIVEDIKQNYQENATNEEKLSFASGKTLADIISLITKKDV